MGRSGGAGGGEGGDPGLKWAWRNLKREAVVSTVDSRQALGQLEQKIATIVRGRLTERSDLLPIGVTGTSSGN